MIPRLTVDVDLAERYSPEIWQGTFSGTFKYLEKIVWSLEIGEVIGDTRAVQYNTELHDHIPTNLGFVA